MNAEMNGRERSIGIALSGGAVRGAAHVGVLRVLASAGLDPCCIAGTSVGAVVGAAWAAGHSADELERLFSTLDWGSLVRPTLKLTRSLMDTRRLAKLYSKRLGLTTFEALKTPFAAVACDLTRGERVVFTEGDLVQAVRASSALPGLFPSEQVEGRVLVDGGVVDYLPVEAARALGARTVVAVDLLPIGNRPRRIGNLFEIWYRSVYLMIRANHPSVGEDCIMIRPDVADFSFTDFKEVPELIRRGEEAARVALPEILRLQEEIS